MTVQPVKPSQPTWAEYNSLARSYMDFMKLRLGQATRVRLLEEARLIAAGLMVQITKTRVDSKGKTRTSWKRVPVKYDDEQDNEAVRHEIDKLRKEMRQQNFVVVKLLELQRLSYHHQQKMKKDCYELYENTPLWKWCLRTKGLGEVAAMTFLGYIKPQIINKKTGQLQTVTTANVWSYAGLTENAISRSGQVSKYNRILKGRCYVIAKNLILQNDPYYTRICRAKKEYYSRTDSHLALKGVKRGWQGWIDAKAKLTMIKLVMSHATEIIVKQNGLKWEPRHENHRYLPPKPVDADQVDKLCRLYEADTPAKIEESNRRYRMKLEASKEDDKDTDPDDLVQDEEEQDIDEQDEQDENQDDGAEEGTNTNTSSNKPDMGE